MTQEAKAKAYDKVLGRAKSLVDFCSDNELKTLKFVFHELTESDDEKIISAIRKAIEAKVENLGNGVTRTACLAWLEKQEDKDSQVKLPTFTFDDILALQCCMETVKKVQEDKELYGQLKSLHDRLYDAYHLEKQSEQNIDPDTLIQQRVDALADIVAEQKPADKIEPKFKIGDWVIDKQGIVHQVANVVEIVTNHTYGYDIVGGGYFNDNVEGVRLWNISDAKEGDVLAFNDDTIVIFKDLYNSSSFHSYCYIEEGIFNTSDVDAPDWWEAEGFHPATKEQHNLLFTKMKEAGYKLDKNFDTIKI